MNKRNGSTPLPSATLIENYSCVTRKSFDAYHLPPFMVGQLARMLDCIANAREPQGLGFDCSTYRQFKT